MEQRSLEINVISAKDLKDVNIVTKMDVYVVVSLSGDSQNYQKFKTNVDRGSGTKPTWNFPVKFTINDSEAQTLVFTLFCDRALGDKQIGQVNVSVKELLDFTSSSSSSSSTQFVSYQVRKPSRKPKGELHFSYKLSPQLAGKPGDGDGDPVKLYPTVEVGPSVATPPWPVVGGYVPVQPSVGYGSGVYYPHPAVSYGGYYPPQPPPHHPPPPGYGYPPPPPPGYGYPTGPGYVYPSYQQGVGPKYSSNNNKFGMGLGAGLAGGTIGGVLIGDMVSDNNGGFGDGGGFAF
ncbi:protein SRC2-like [Humulus lupulus]|uniref:protein SRC2-like n=1 Tax=Humulus lupulus TaxID=3486 RepID=UPI002B416AD0|nr:protein SRC2-like [Humulus lupulus]